MKAIIKKSEAPRGMCPAKPLRRRKPRGIFARLGGARPWRSLAEGRTFGEARAEPCDLSAEAIRAKAEARDCGNLLCPRGYDLPSPAEAGYAKAGGREPQGILAKKGDGDPRVASLVLPARAEHCITVAGKDTLSMNKSLRAAARELKAAILNRFVFAASSHYEDYRKNMAAEDGRVAWLNGEAGRNGGMASMQAFAISGAKPASVKINGRELGFIYEDDFARYCRLSGVHPKNLKAGRPEQAREVFEIMDMALRKEGFGFTDTVRTWFSLSKLLEWYKEFNDVRTSFFSQAGIFEKMVPASTGIGAANQYGAALMCDLLAIQPKTAQVRIQAVPSPLQESALNYKSSFSRAVETTFPTHRALFISGTASIDTQGQSAHAGNPAGQIELTMKVVGELLRSRGMDWNDLFRGIAYFKNMDDRPLFDLYCREHGVPAFTFAHAHRDICRSELLFEIEADAITTD